jgi:hypothetical protein
MSESVDAAPGTLERALVKQAKRCLFVGDDLGAKDLMYSLVEITTEDPDQSLRVPRTSRP